MEQAGVEPAFPELIAFWRSLLCPLTNCQCHDTIRAMSKEIVDFAKQHYPDFVPDCDLDGCYVWYQNPYASVADFGFDAKTASLVTAYRWPARIINDKIAISDQSALCVVLKDERINPVKLFKCVKLIEHLERPVGDSQLIACAIAEYPDFVPDVDDVLRSIPCPCPLIPAEEVAKAKANPNIVECREVLATRWPVCAVQDAIVVSKQVAACLVIRDERLPVNLVKCFDFWS